MIIMSNIVDVVVDRGLCSGCGVCAGHCPSGILKMATLANGDLAAAICGQCEDKCSVCLSVCPFAKGYHDPRPRNTELFGQGGDEEQIFDENIGNYSRTFVGYLRSSGRRASSASGGLLTWCLETLLVKKMVDKVAVVRLAKDRQTSLFEFFIANSPEEIRNASSSIYHPVEISSLVRSILAEPNTKWAIVGVPCLCAAIRNSKRLDKQVEYILGLACGMYQNTMYTEMLLSKSGIPTKDVSEINYRKKNKKGPSNNFLFCTKDRSGRLGRDVEYKKLPFFLGINACFRLNACNFCKDVFAETADACFMDAWLPEYIADPKGTSLVVTRNKEIEALFPQGEQADDLWIKDIPPESAVRSQQGHVRRKRELIYWRLGELPDNKFVTHPSLYERIDWWIQRRAQRKSKHVWGKYGRKYGRVVFWAMMTDVLVLRKSMLLILVARKVIKKLIMIIKGSVLQLGGKT